MLLEMTGERRNKSILTNLNVLGPAFKERVLARLSISTFFT